MHPMLQRYQVMAGVLIVISLGPGAAGPLCADVFQSVDTHGVVHLTNVPTTSGYHVMIRAPRLSPIDIAPGRRLSGKSIPYSKVVTKVAQEQNLDQALLHAVIAAESGYNPQAVSSVGAVGLMQLMPATAQHYGVFDRTDPEANILAGARYLHDLMHRFHNDLPLVLAAYNAGENAVIHYGNHIPPYPETQQYVPRVLNLYRKFRSNSQ